MKAVRRLELETFRFVSERVNHLTTVVDSEIGRTVISFAKW